MERLYRSFSPRPQIIKKTQCPRANDFVDWYFSTRLDGDRGSTSVQQHGSARSFLSTRKHASKMKETRAYAELVCDTLAASFDFPATVQPERFCIALCQSPLCARFPVYPTINPFLSSSFRRCSIARFLASVLLPLSISSFLATSQPSAIRLRRATFRRFLRVFRLASIFFPNKLFVPCEFIYFYQRAQRSWEPGQRFVSFLESIKPYGLLIALICFFSRRYLSLFVISMERLPLPIRRNHDSPFPLYTIRLPYRSASFTVVVRFHFQQNIFLSKLKSIENCPFHPSFPRLRLFI